MADFVDTSALIKLYVPEIGSRWMRSSILPKGIAVSDLASAEVGVTLARLVRDGAITEAAGRNAWRLFRRQLRSFLVFNLDRRSLVAAAYLASRTPIPLRTLDAIQLQGAMEARSDAQRGGAVEPLVISADSRLLLAAQAHGFKTESPLNHP